MSYVFMARFISRAHPRNDWTKPKKLLEVLLRLLNPEQGLTGARQGVGEQLFKTSKLDVQILIRTG